jgi:integrase/recombinase XerD
MDAALNQFYQHLQVERGLARLTVEAYARDLQAFWGFLSLRGTTGWAAVDLADLQDYFAALEAKGLSARSRARKLSALRQFFRFLQREEQVSANPVELLDSPRLP